MAHPNESVLRDAYAAFARGDLDAFFKLYTHTPRRIEEKEDAE